MAIGSTRLARRRPGEVRYYDANVTSSVFAEDLNQRVPPPYGAFYLEAMDAHGAWIASAVDLVRFASAFDDFDDSKLLKRESIETMFARPEGLAGHDAEGRPKSTAYAMGWQVVYDRDGQPRFVQHGGALAGTSTKLIRRNDGRNVAILFNARQTRKTNRPSDEILERLHPAIDQVKVWPAIDLFEAETDTSKVSTD
jgi:N-acyl-D-amino-acid deacylase